MHGKDYPGNDNYPPICCDASYTGTFINKQFY